MQCNRILQHAKFSCSSNFFYNIYEILTLAYLVVSKYKPILQSNESTKSYWSSGRKYRAPPPPTPSRKNSYNNVGGSSTPNKISIKEKLKISWSKESTRRQCYVWSAFGLFLLSLIILVIIIVGRFIKIPDNDDNNPENPSISTEFPTLVLEYDDDEEWEVIKPIRAESSVN